MKKIISFAAIAAVAVLTAACAKEQNFLNENAVSYGMRTLTFTGVAGNPALNKTTLGEDGVCVNWNEDDSLYIFYHENDGIRVGNSIAHITSIDGDTGAATFTVKVAEDALLDVVYACYNPADRDNLLTRNPLTLNPTKSDDGICTYARAEFMTRQIAKKNSYDSASASMVARWINDGSDTPFFDFYNLGAFVNFEVENTSSYQIDSVSISFGGSFFRYYYGFNDAEDATDDINIYTTSGKYTEVTLVGPLESGNKYYVAMTPNTNFTTPKIKFYINGWGVKEFSNETTIRLARNQSLNIGKFSFDDSSFPSTLSLDVTGTQILMGTSLSFNVTSSNINWTASVTKGGVSVDALDVTSGSSGTTKITVTLPLNTTEDIAEYVVTLKSLNPSVEDKSFTIKQVKAVPFGTTWGSEIYSGWKAAAKNPYIYSGLYALSGSGNFQDSNKQVKGTSTLEFVTASSGQGIVTLPLKTSASVDVYLNDVKNQTIKSSSATTSQPISTTPIAVVAGDKITCKQTVSGAFVILKTDSISWAEAPKE